MSGLRNALAVILSVFWIGTMLILFTLLLSETNKILSVFGQLWAPIGYVVTGFILGCFLGHRPPPHIERENPPKQDEGK